MKKINKTYSNLQDLPKKMILGIGVTDETKENILEYILKSLQNLTKPYYIVTPNPEIIVAANKNNDLKNVLNNANLALNDGVGVGLAAQIMGISLKERFTGVELVEKVCEKSNDWPITVGFLGAGPNVAEKTAECLKSRYPKLRVGFIGTEWHKENVVLGKKYVVTSNLYKAKDKKKKILHTSYDILDTDVIDILFVAFGAPKQEFWMAEHVGRIPVKVMVGVGGAFDQIAGVVPRASKLVRRLGFEWLFRLIIQPWRWKRQLALIEFLGMVLQERFRK